MGAIDSLGKQGDARHEDIAKKGRLETEQGIAAFKGQPAPVASGAGVGEGHPDNTGLGVSAASEGSYPAEKSAEVGQPYQPSQGDSVGGKT